MNRGQWIEHCGWYITYNLTLPLIISTTNTLQEHILNNQLFQKSWNSGRWQGWSQARFTQQMWNHLPPRLLHCFPSGKGLREGEQICSRKLLLKAWWSQEQLTKRSYMQAGWVWMRSFWRERVRTLVGICSLPFSDLLPPSSWTMRPSFSGLWRMPSPTPTHGKDILTRVMFKCGTVIIIQF